MKDGQIGLVTFFLKDFEFMREEKPLGMIFQLGDIRCHVVELTGEEVPDSSESISIECGVGQIFVVCAKERTKKIRPCECLIYGSLGTRCVLRSVKDGLVRHHHVNFTLKGPVFESIDQVVKETESA